MITNNCRFMGTVFEIAPISMTQSGRKCCKLTVSVRIGKDSQDKSMYEYIPCRAYEARADLLARYFTKGKAIALETHVHRYKAENGTTYTEFIVDEIGFVPNDYVERQQEEQPRQTQRYDKDLPDDLPF